VPCRDTLKVRPSAHRDCGYACGGQSACLAPISSSSGGYAPPIPLMGWGRRDRCATASAGGVVCSLLQTPRSTQFFGISFLFLPRRCAHVRHEERLSRPTRWKMCDLSVLFLHFYLGVGRYKRSDRGRHGLISFICLSNKCSGSEPVWL
jgi:hypothetical protein